MPLLFECPQCGDRRVLAAQSIGRRVRCPACESLIEVVLPEDSSELGIDPQATAAVTAEMADAGTRIITGVAISSSAASPQDLRASEAVPGVPILAMDDDEDAEEKVVLKSKPEDAEMDMTPMVDVTFLLLIFFMVTASFAVQKSLPMPAPKDKEAAAASQATVQEMEDDSDFITVRVDQFGTFFVQSPVSEDEFECPSEQELLNRLREAKRGDGSGNAPTKLLVIAHGDALHERVVMALDAGVTAEIDSVQLATSEDDEGA
jgi:biopolymer transport protein ExbD